MMSPSRRESGFVLVGVVMLVLALTILGLSLFSLSSYEAQFLGDSVDDLQAYNLAGGALERARLVLLWKKDLRTVKQDLPPGIDSTIAWQEQNGSDAFSGPIQWSTGKAIWIRARASYHGSVRVLMAAFEPRPGIDYYRHLMTIPDTLKVEDIGGGTSVERWPQTSLDGEIWIDQPQPDDTWRTRTLGDHPVNMWDNAPSQIPTPDVQNYFIEHLRPAGTPPNGTLDAGHPGTYAWSLGVADSVTYYQSLGDQPVPAPYMTTADEPQAPYFSVLIPSGNMPPPPDSRTVRVHGTVVWMFEHGFRSQSDFTVLGDDDDRDCLIMVSKPNKGLPGGDHNVEYYPIGIWFFGGVNVSGARLILISDGEVRIEHSNSLTGNTTVTNLTIYSRKAWILGPQPNGKLQLTHPNPHPEPDPLLDWFSERRVLPNQGQRYELKFITGTWSESHPIP